MKKLVLIIICIFMTLGCSFNKEKIPCYKSEEFKDAIEVLKDTKTIVMYKREFDEKTKEIYLSKIKELNEDKTNKIVDILVKSEEWTGAVSLPFPRNELQFYNKEGEKIATYIYNGASDLIMDNKTYVLTNFDKTSLDMLINNADSKLKL